MGRRLLGISGAMLLALCTLGSLLWAQAKNPPTVPPFVMDAGPTGTITLDMKKRTLVYARGKEAPVKCTSPLYTTTITCDKLVANALVDRKSTSVTATGAVTLALTVPGETKEDPTYLLNGTTKKLVFTLEKADRKITLETVNGVHPVLVLTNQTTKEETKVTGETIIYQLEEQQLEVKGGVISSSGDEQ